MTDESPSDSIRDGWRELAVCAALIALAVLGMLADVGRWRWGRRRIEAAEARLHGHVDGGAGQ